MFQPFHAPIVGVFFIIIGAELIGASGRMRMAVLVLGFLHCNPPDVFAADSDLSTVLVEKEILSQGRAGSFLLRIPQKTAMQ